MPSDTTDSLNALKDQFVEQAKLKLDELKDINLLEKRSDLTLEEIATAGLNGNSEVTENSNGADILIDLFNVFNTQFVGKFFDIIKDTMNNQQIMAQAKQSGIISKREAAKPDELKIKLDKKIDQVLQNNQKLGSKMMNKYLDLSKGFSKKLKDITVELVQSIKPIQSD